MSLINDALKKAQKMHHEEAAAAAANLSPGSHAPRHRGKGSYSAGTVALISAGVAVLVCGTVLTTILVLRRAPAPATTPMPEARPSDTGVVDQQSQPAEQAQVQPSTQKSVAPEAMAPAPQPKPEASGPMLSLANLSASKPQPTETPTAPAVPAQPAAATESPASPVPSFVFSTPEPDNHKLPNPAIQRYVDRLRVSGVRKTGSGSKVIINDKVYRINDVVDRALGVRLTEAEGDRLVFTDEYGHRYVRNF